MTTKRLGLIMNGVTGRMGLNQHLIRSIVAIRDQGGVLLANGDRMMPDPILVGRDADKVEAPRQALQRRALVHRSRQGAGRQERHHLLRRRDHAGAALAADQGDQRRQARLLRKADRDQSGRGGRGAEARQRQGRQARHGAGQAVPAGPEEARLPARFRLLRPHALGARRVRLLGVRGRLAGGAAAVVELPQRGRRRHHSRHGLPLALRARQSLRRGRERELPRHHGYSRALRREGQEVQGDRRRFRLRHLPPQGRRDRAYQHELGDAGLSRRSRHLPGRRHPRLGGGGPDRLRDPGAAGDAAAGVESGREAHPRFLRRLAEGAGERRLRQRLQGAVGDVHPPRLRGRALQIHAAGRRQGRAARRMRAAELARAALDRRRPDQGVRRHNHEQACPADVIAVAETADGGSLDRNLSPRGVADVSGKARRHAEPRGVLGRACGGRSARRCRSVADRRDRLGPDHCVPRACLGPRPRRRRSDGHRAARHGAGLADLAGTDPALGEGGQGQGQCAGVFRRRHRSPRGRGCQNPSTT